jgi:hypothetical protein
MLRSCLSILFIFVSSFAYAWDLNDVSILLPLPSADQMSLLLAPDTQAAYGELLPMDAQKFLPTLTRPEESAGSQLRVVGIRIDPCFPALDPAHPEKCRAQIRMVWQLLMPSGALDAALHSFYELKPNEFSDLLKKIQKLNVASGIPNSHLPLGVHPLIQAQGLQGAYWSALKQLLLEYVGADRLSRVTFMSLEIPLSMWDFGGADFVQGRIKRIQIPRVHTRAQSFVNSAGPQQFAGGARPSPSGADTLTDILEESSKFINDPSASSKVHSISDTVYRIENPNIHNSESMDCVSCHMASSVRSWSEQSFPDLHLQENPFQFHSALGLNLINTSLDQKSTINLRSFGYYGANPAVSQRVINESAAVVEKLESVNTRGHTF